LFSRSFALVSGQVSALSNIVRISVIVLKAQVNIFVLVKEEPIRTRDELGPYSWRRKFIEVLGGGGVRRCVFAYTRSTPCPSSARAVCPAQLILTLEQRQYA